MNKIIPKEICFLSFLIFPLLFYSSPWAMKSNCNDKKKKFETDSCKFWCWLCFSAKLVLIIKHTISIDPTNPKNPGS